LSDQTAEQLERTFAFVTGNHFINYHSSKILSKSLKYLPVRDFNAQEIVPNLYLGDVYAAHNTKALNNHKITHIVTCAVGVYPPFPEQFKYKHLNVLDCAAENMNEHFDETSQFISDALKDGGRVLVHCIRGVSRSATIVAAYLMMAFKISHNEAVETVRAKRAVARPNYGFMMQLEMYHSQLKQQLAHVSYSPAWSPTRIEMLSIQPQPQPHHRHNNTKNTNTTNSDYNTQQKETIEELDGASPSQQPEQMEDDDIGVISLPPAPHKDEGNNSNGGDDENLLESTKEGTHKEPWYRCGST